MRIEPIITHYNGCKYRSRIEARWAVFYDLLGISFEYEKEGYNIDGKWYLPDFYLPQQDCWIEIKGYEPTNEEVSKLADVCGYTEKQGYMFHGAIPYYQNPQTPNSGACSIFPELELDYRWCECYFCGKIEIQREGASSHIDCCDDNKYWGGGKLLKLPVSTHNSQLLVSAYSVSRSYIF